MPSATETPSRRDRQIAGFAAVAILIHLLEAGLPSPVPGIKPGLANIVTLVVLLRHGLAAAVWVTGLRVLVGSLLVGSFLAPGFWLSAAGATASLAALAAGLGLARGLPLLAPSVIGLSALSAVAHVAGQFLLAWSVFVPHPGLLALLPPLLTAALALGLVTGVLAQRLLQRLPPLPE
jgi:heptaprenyl diphosphate synthase